MCNPFNATGEQMRILLGLFMASLLILAGCPQDDGNGPGTVPGTPGGGAVPPQGGGSQQGGGQEPPEPEPAIPDEFASWDIEVMMALGQPVHCTVSYEEDTFSTESELFFKGEKMRVESTSTMDGETFDTNLILIGNVSYISMDGQDYGLGDDCEWVKMDFERLAECTPEEFAEDVESSTEAFDATGEYEDAPSDFNCGYGSFGDEKFVPQGKVCDLTEELCQLYEMYGSGGGYPSAPPLDPSVCDGLTGDDYDSCMEAVNSYYG
jgi:hypothetical protein